MTTAAIELPALLRVAIYAHARTEFPAECCGYLAGPDDAVDRAVACRNAQAGAPDAYAIDGRELFDLVRSFATAEPARVVYHSHPNGRAYLSATDRALARTPDGPIYPVQHLVVGVTAERVTECAQFAWDARANDFVEIARWVP